MPDKSDKDKASGDEESSLHAYKTGDEDKIEGEVMDEGEAPDAEEAADDAATKSGEPSGVKPGGGDPDSEESYSDESASGR